MTAASNSESRKRLAESAAVETALTDDERDALAEAAYRRTVAWSRTAITPWSGLHDFQREQQRNPGVERVVETILAARIEQARAEGAADALRAAADEWRQHGPFDVAAWLDDLFLRGTR